MAHTTTPAREPTVSATSDASLTVLVADKFPDTGLAAMRDLGCRVECNADLSPDKLVATMRTLDPDVLIVRSTKVNEQALAAGAKLSLIIRAGAGFDTIDVAAASARGVFVSNCPGKNALAVAELTWALILACDRRIPEQTADLKAGRWDKKTYGKAPGLFGRTLGIVGLGRIGEAVAHRGKAFGMKVVAWSRSLTPEKADAMGIGYCASPLDVAGRADVVSLHVAATPETRHLVNDAFLTAMKEGATLINTTRGSVVDEVALARAVRAKRLRVGLDVYEDEPGGAGETFSSPIVAEGGVVVGTHHVGASTDQAQHAIASETVRILRAWTLTGDVPNCVNRAAASPATNLLTVRHLNRPGVLAHVFHVLSEAAINVEEMENVIFEGAKAACARIQLDSPPTAAQIRAIRENANVLSTNVSEVRRA